MPNDTQIAKWGNSLAVRIPQAIVREARLAEGDRLSIDLAGDGSVVLRPGHRKYSLDELVAGIKPGNRHRETDWGTQQGKERW
jgi:antitoxin MazE